MTTVGPQGPCQTPPHRGVIPFHSSGGTSPVISPSKSAAEPRPQIPDGAPEQRQQRSPDGRHPAQASHDRGGDPRDHSHDLLSDPGDTPRCRMAQRRDNTNDGQPPAADRPYVLTMKPSPIGSAPHQPASKASSTGRSPKNTIQRATRPTSPMTFRRAYMGRSRGRAGFTIPAD